jgi:hypothetical protein
LPLHVGKKINLRERLLIQESLNVLRLEGVVSLVKSIIGMTLLIEGVGGLILSLRFTPQLGWARGIYYGFFHSISSFCNAGFDLFGIISGPFSSLTAYSGDAVVSLTIPLLIILGGLGFVVIRDLYYNRRFSSLLLHSKVVLAITAVLVVGGTILFWLLEQGNALQQLSPGGAILASFYQAVTPRTCGSNTLDISSLRGATQFFMIILMFIGASPSTPAVADNHKCGTCNEVIGRSQNTVDCRLTCAVPVVEKVFCQSIIHSYKGIFECAIPGHGSQPDHTCGGLFCTADHAFRLLRALLMKGCNQVSSIIDGQIGFHVQGGTDLFVIRIIIHTAAGKCWYFIDHIECCSYVILGAEGI